MGDSPSSLSRELSLGSARAVASRLHKIVSTLGASLDYRDAAEWGQARVTALQALRESIGSLTDADLSDVGVSIARNLSTIIANDQVDDEEGEHLRAVLATILSPPDDFDSLLFKVHDNITSFSVAPGEDPDNPDGYSPVTPVLDLVGVAATPVDLRGRRVVVTGDFAFGTRDRVHARLQELGARTAEQATHPNDVLILGACCVMPDGSVYLSTRLRGAMESGATILHEAQVLAQLHPTH